MGRKPKFNKAVKIQACEDYKLGKGSFRNLAKKYGCNYDVMRRWYYTYEIHGPSAFDVKPHNRTYSKEFKSTVVSEYNSGSYSTIELSAKYNIARQVISIWINNGYNDIENKEYNPKGEVYTMESRKTTYEERLAIVEWVIANNMDYKNAADKNGVKYALVYQWVQKYLKDGAKALKHKKRGPKPKIEIDKSSLSELEKLRLELENEKKLRKEAELTVKILKKKKVFEKKLRSQK